MRITIIGHASLLIETEDVSIITDPVYADPFGDEVRVSCPKREVDLSKFPKVDILWLSHDHNDHFDIDTLGMLPNMVDHVLCADHPHILKAFDALGYESVQPIQDYDQINIGDTSLIMTPSELKAPEHGLIVKSPNGTLWNQVDSLFNMDHIQLMKQNGPYDVFFANFNPLLPTEIMTNGKTSFPAETYQELMHVIRNIDAKMVVPWASGQVFQGPGEWLNRYFFPLSHQRFINDLKTLGLNTGKMLYPGDVVVIEDGKMEVLEAHADFVTCTNRDMSVADFRPGSPIPALVDDNMFGVDETILNGAVGDVMEKIRASLVRGETRDIDILADWDAVMAITVHGPSSTEHWSIRFSRDGSTLVQGREPDANFFIEVTKSGLYGVENGLLLDRFARGMTRSFHTLYRVSRAGFVSPNEDSQGRNKPFEVSSPYDVLIKLWGSFQDELWLDNQINRVLETRTILKPGA